MAKPGFCRNEFFLQLNKKSQNYSMPERVVLNTEIHVQYENNRVPAPEDLKNLRLFKAFSFNNSRPIQGLLPVDHSTAYNPTGTGEKNTPI